MSNLESTNLNLFPRSRISVGDAECGLAQAKTGERAALLDQFDAREISHVTFGSVLTARTADGRLRFYDRLMNLLRENPEAYAANLERHFLRHLKPFAAA